MQNFPEVTEWYNIGARKQNSFCRVLFQDQVFQDQVVDKIFCKKCSMLVCYSELPTECSLNGGQMCDAFCDLVQFVHYK